MAREADVVEADDRQIVGGTRSPRRRAVSITPIAISSLKQKIAVGGSLAAEQALGRRRAGLDREVAVHDDEVALGALLLRARRRAAQAIAAERADQRTGDDADPAVAQAVEMVHRLGGGLGVVDVHARDAEARARTRSR